jgi:hypothetical protein
MQLGMDGFSSEYHITVTFHLLPFVSRNVIVAFKPESIMYFILMAIADDKFNFGSADSFLQSTMFITRNQHWIVFRNGVYAATDMDILNLVVGFPLLIRAVRPNLALPSRNIPPEVEF